MPKAVPRPPKMAGLVACVCVLPTHDKAKEKKEPNLKSSLAPSTVRYLQTILEYTDDSTIALDLLACSAWNPWTRKESEQHGTHTQSAAAWWERNRGLLRAIATEPSLVSRAGSLSVETETASGEEPEEQQPSEEPVEATGDTFLWAIRE